MTFDRRKFTRNAHQLAHLADGYKALGVDTDTAVAFANRGFTPAEAQPWIDANLDAGTASHYANQFKSPAEAVADLNRRR